MRTVSHYEIGRVIAGETNGINQGPTGFEKSQRCLHAWKNSASIDLILARAIDVAALGMQWIRKQVRASTTRPNRCPKGAVRGGKALSMPPGFNRLQHLDALSRR